MRSGILGAAAAFALKEAFSREINDSERERELEAKRPVRPSRHSRAVPRAPTARDLKRAQRWLRANPGNPKPPGHIAETLRAAGMAR